MDRVLIVGAVRTNPETIRRELLLRPGQPLGYSDSVESRARLAALGLFRRVDIEESAAWRTNRGATCWCAWRRRRRPRSAAAAAWRARSACAPDETGQAEERFELVPRGFFEIGRRNLWGKNRAVNLFTRVSVRNRDVGLNEDGTPGRRAPRAATRLQRVSRRRHVPRAARVRRPRPTCWSPASWSRRSGPASTSPAASCAPKPACGSRPSTACRAATRSSGPSSSTSGSRPTKTRASSIGCFPQVRLSILSGSFLRDSRDDLVDASRGTLVTITSDLAMRAIGSEVGFVKTYFEAFSFRQLPTARRAVLALGARLGAGQRIPTGGAERGRGRGADGGSRGRHPRQQALLRRRRHHGARLLAGPAGRREHHQPAGVPHGRQRRRWSSTARCASAWSGRCRPWGSWTPATSWRGRRSCAWATCGRPRASASATDRRWARSASTSGFKLDRRELSPGRLERRSVWHISFGQAF